MKLKIFFLPKNAIYTIYHLILVVNQKEATKLKKGLLLIYENMWRDHLHTIWNSVSNTERINVWCFVFSLASFCTSLCVLLVLKLIRREFVYFKSEFCDRHGELFPQSFAHGFKRQRLNG